MGLCPGGKANPGNDATTATEKKYSAGVVTGGENAIYPKKMLHGTEANAGVIPREVSDQLIGKTYSNWDEFRADFWKAVANSSYANEFIFGDDMSNIYRMGYGYAPTPMDGQVIPGSGTYQIHHIKPVSQGGGVYDINNLVIVTPRYHAEILIPEYHGYNGFKKYFK